MSFFGFSLSSFVVVVVVVVVLMSLMKCTSRALSPLSRSAQNHTQRVEDITALPFKQKQQRTFSLSASSRSQSTTRASSVSSFSADVARRAAAAAAAEVDGPAASSSSAGERVPTISGDVSRGGKRERERERVKEDRGRAMRERRSFLSLSPRRSECFCEGWFAESVFFFSPTFPAATSQFLFSLSLSSSNRRSKPTSSSRLFHKERGRIAALRLVLSRPSSCAHGK